MWSDFPKKKFNIIQIAGICGIFIPVVIFTCLGFSIGSSPWFTWTQHALSDLGIQQNTAWVFNNGVILGGILTFIFSFGLLQILSNKIGAYLLLLSSVALIGIGIFPETIFVVHYITSASFFILLIIALLIIGLTSKKNTFEYKIGICALVFALIALSSIIFLFYFEGIAIPEAFSCFPAFIWCSMVGIHMAHR